MAGLHEYDFDLTSIFGAIDSTSRTWFTASCGIDNDTATVYIYICILYTNMFISKNCCVRIRFFACHSLSSHLGGTLQKIVENP